MLQKELAKRLKARYDTKMDGKGKTNNSIKAEYKMESARLVQVKDRPFFSAVGQKVWLLCKAS